MEVDPVSLKLLVKYFIACFDGQHHDVLIFENVGTASAQLSNYHRFFETFLWSTHAVSHSTNPLLEKNGGVFTCSRSLSIAVAACSCLPTCTSKIPMFWVTLYIALRECRNDTFSEMKNVGMLEFVVKHCVGVTTKSSLL